MMAAGCHPMTDTQTAEVAHCTNLDHAKQIESLVTIMTSSFTI